MEKDELLKYIRSLDNDALARERTSGKLMAEAQELMDSEFERRNSPNYVAQVDEKENKKRGFLNLAFWEWIIIVLVIRGIFKFLQSQGFL